jgi:bifunctional non-homologous end joining protein LigD
MPQGSLQQYRRKRDFRHTPEPRGVIAGKAFKGRFVVHKHAARQRHYDLRLELGGTLKSWAVPKGPSLNPQERRLAVQVEDHPLEYAAFEGVIPQNQYGGGTVMLWDEGAWLPEDADPQAAYDKGHLHFTLKGHKIKGRWSLVRLHAMDVAEKNWLLIKHDDDYAALLDADDLDAHSVTSHRTLDQIASARDKAWDVDHEKIVTRHVKQQKLPSKGRKALLPDFIAPQLAMLVDRPPEGDDWLHELKYDGYRIFARVDHGEITLLTRNAKDWTQRFPAIHAAIKNLGLSSAWLDGEVCFVNANGSTSFQALQNALEENHDTALVYFVFDLLYVNGRDLSQLNLPERKQMLAALLKDAGDIGPMRFADHLQGQGAAFYEQVCGCRLEGVISKRADRPHNAGRSREWQKIKCLQRQEFVIGGYTRARGARTGFAALLLGVYEVGRFIYTGKVGTGFNEESLQALYRRLEKLRIEHSPYDISPPREIAREAMWVAPQLVAEIEFKEWTRDGCLRQPSFKGLREDKKPMHAKRERPQPSMPSPVQRAPSVAGVALSNPNKALYPPEGITKLDLARYYEYVAERMLPYVIDRPLTLLRCPDGYTAECFFQKRDVDESPKALKPVTVMEKGVPVQYLTIQSQESLIALVQMGVLEIHTWGARADRSERPDLLVFDIDPHEQVPWKTVIHGAHTLRALLNELGLVSFVKATGGKGLHVVVPITRRHTWPEVKTFTRAVADAMVQFDHSLYTASISKKSRPGKMYIDYVRNSEGATAVAPYSTRARPGAPVAVPLDWDEVDELASPNYFTIKNIHERLEQLNHDPWEKLFSRRQTITQAMKRSLGIA